MNRNFDFSFQFLNNFTSAMSSVIFDCTSFLTTITDRSKDFVSYPAIIGSTLIFSDPVKSTINSTILIEFD